jgi:tRNA nucleotidyltransferase (CCA-adding enzyme)
MTPPGDAGRHATDRPAADRKAIEKAMLERVKPTAQEEAALHVTVTALLEETARALAAAGVRATPTVQGSVAKGTWLRTSTDIDLFLLLDPAVPAAELDTLAAPVAAKVLQDPERKYAQHPYVTGTYRGVTVDLVPAYAVPAASAKMSAVDRTPFHTQWVLAHLDAARRDEARLLKQWLKGVGVYGAQTAVGGFSGYLAELLVARFGSFAGVLDHLAGGAQPRRIKLTPEDTAPDDAPLVVVDPVDPARNCAAAVQADALERACEGARAYQAAPSERFFFPRPPRAEPAAALERELEAKGEAWMGLLVRPRTRRLDIVFPQFQRAGRTIDAALAEAGFRVRRSRVDASPDGAEILFQWVCERIELPAQRVHEGPATAVAPNAERFRAKWEGHPDAAGPVTERGGRLQVPVRIAERTALEWLTAKVSRLPLGKHVEESLPADVLGAVANAPPAWQPAVADHVLDRRPWAR